MTPNRGKPEWVQRCEYMAGRLRTALDCDLRLTVHPLIFEGDSVRVAACAFVQAPAGNDNSGDN